MKMFCQGRKVVENVGRGRTRKEEEGRRIRRKGGVGKEREIEEGERGKW